MDRRLIYYLTASGKCYRVCWKRKNAYWNKKMYAGIPPGCPVFVAGYAGKEKIYAGMATEGCEYLVPSIKYLVSSI
jgi:hypothetical protein